MRTFIAGVVSLAVLWGIGGFYIVKEGQQALPVMLGAPKDAVTEPGLEWRPLGLTEVIFYESRILSLAPGGLSPILKDKKRIEVDGFIRWQINDPLEFFKSFGAGRAEAERRISSIFGDELRAELGQQNLEDLLSERRAPMMERIKQGVHTKLRGNGISIVDVRIRRADLPEDISKAIYQRMNTERVQEANEIRANGDKQANEIRSTADREVIEILSAAEQKAAVLRGEGDKEAIRIYADSFGQDPEFYAFYRSLEAYRKAMKKDTTLVLDPSSPFFRYFNGPTGAP